MQPVKPAQLLLGWCRLLSRHRKCCMSQLSYLTVQLSESDSFFLSISSSLSWITKRQEGHWGTEGTPQERQPVPAVAPSSQLPSWFFFLARVICFFSISVSLDGRAVITFVCHFTLASFSLSILYIMLVALIWTPFSCRVPLSSTNVKYYCVPRIVLGTRNVKWS